MTERGLARRLAAESLEAGEPLAWFEKLYKTASGDAAAIPWADLNVNPNLGSWLKTQSAAKVSQRALVVGCGLGDDSEAVAELGFEVTAFDISPTCIEWCRERFPNSRTKYEVGDVFELPEHWRSSFDLVLEIYTLQVLPPDLRLRAMDRIAECVAPQGTLLVITRGRDPLDDPGKMPWPLVRSELARFVEQGLREVRFEDYVEEEDPPVRRFRAEYIR